VRREGYRVGLPAGGAWRTLLNTDDPAYGGTGAGPPAVEAAELPWHDQPWSAELTLPALSVLWLVPGGS
jgi:1,4-alpha-glucan branching enzyme